MSRPWVGGIEVSRQRKVDLGKKAHSRTEPESLRLTSTSSYDALLRAIDYKDCITGGHTRRVGKCCQYMTCFFDKSLSDIINEPAQLHDIGKIGIPDHLLFRIGKFNEEDRSIINTHSVVGYNILNGINVFSDPVKNKVMLDIVLRHHENWDGSGYPDQLSGTKIPLSARIMKLVDILDSLVNDRPYKRAMPFGEAVAQIKRESEEHKLDPEVTRVFLRKRREIYNLFYKNR